MTDPLIDAENINGGNSASYLIRNHHRKSLKLYEKLIDNGVCREQARGVLPQNMYTEYYATVNLSNLLKFVNLRMHAGAQWKIQEAARAMLNIAKGAWPLAVGAYMTQKESRNE